MSNPVFDRIDKDVRSGYAGFGSPQGQYGQPQPPGGYGGYPPGQHGSMSPQQLDDMYQQPSAVPVAMGRVTVDDVVMKTASLFGLLLVAAAVCWFMVPANPGLASVLALGSVVATLGLGIAIALKKTVSVPLIVTYALLEGVLVGTVSRFFEYRWPGIVVTAVVATLSVFAAMLLGYRTRIIKVTQRSRRIFSLAIMGYMVFALVNFGFAVFGANQGWGIFGRGSGLSIVISLLAVGLASYSLAMDFDSIESAVAAQVPQKYSWLLAHGLIVTVVWLYLEMLRLFGNLNSD